jgi:transposase
MDHPAAEACVSKRIRNFAASLLRDRNAIEAALEQPWINDNWKAKSID